MRRALVAFAALPLGLAACGHGAAPGPWVPDVRGARLADAAAKLIDAQLCVKLRVDPTLGGDRVRRESPAPGTRLARWAPVTIAIGLPAEMRAGKATFTLGFDVVAFSPKTIPCPPIRATG